jgi:FkbM family methyltransferase
MQRIAHLPEQKAVCALVTDCIGDTRTFHVANNEGASSSIYDFAMHKDIWPEVSCVGELKLTTTTLDTILLTSGGPAYDTLVMDVQGADLLVLKGAMQTLPSLKFVKTEAADFESYKGCTTVDELTAFLSKFGFHLVGQECFAKHPVSGGYFELLFRR